MESGVRRIGLFVPWYDIVQVYVVRNMSRRNLGKKLATHD
jgi:hypothetical protein